MQTEQLGKQVSSPTGTLTILQDINLQITAGERVAIVGVSGSGKSTLLGLLAGLDIPTQGKVFLDGVELNTLDEDGRARLRRQRVGFVFQTFQLINTLTAMENVMLPLELSGYDNPVDRARLQLDRVGLSDRLHHYPNQLSGGEQQRVAIARAFATDPALLFADEPTGNLDQKTAEKVINLLFEMNDAHGTTLVLVTHDEAIAGHCDRCLVISGGQLVNTDENTVIQSA